MSAVKAWPSREGRGRVDQEGRRLRLRMAMTSMGARYEVGKGVPQDKTKAYTSPPWLS